MMTLNAKYKYVLFIGIIFLLVSGNIFGNIDIGLIEDDSNENGLFLRYTASENYDTAPENIWNSQLFTIRWPISLGPDIIVSTSNLVAFSFMADGPIVNGGDEYYYAKYSSAADNVSQDFFSGTDVTVFHFEVSPGTDRCLLELISFPNSWVENNTGRTAINNSVAGEIFNAFNPASCGVTDIEEPENNFPISIFPSPTSGICQLEFASSYSGKGILKIYDDSGKMVLEKKVDIFSSLNRIEINLKAYSSGIYLAKLEFDEIGWAGEILKIE